MADIIENPSEAVFNYWKTIVSPIVGANNLSMDQPTQIEKKPFARLFMMGSPVRQADLDGNEISTSISFQAESYGTGRKALDDAYKIDSASHQAMVNMGFERYYGPELIQSNNEPLVRRVISRYQRIYTGYFLV